MTSSFDLKLGEGVRGSWMDGELGRLMQLEIKTKVTVKQRKEGLFFEVKLKYYL